MLKKNSIIIIILTCILIFCSCGNSSPYLPLSDVVVKLLKEEGLSNCHITNLTKFKHMGFSFQLPDGYNMEDGIKEGIENITDYWIENAEFDLDETEVEAFDGDIETIKRYLVVGVMGYRKWKNQIPEAAIDAGDIHKQYELFERELALSYVEKIGYEEDFTDETPLEKVPGFYYERLIYNTVKCNLSDEYTTYNGNKIYIKLDETSEFYNKMKELNGKCLVFEYWVSDPEWYPSLFDFSDGTTIYKNNGMHSEHEDKNKDFSKGHILFIGIDKNDITDQSYLTFDRISEKFH